MPIRLPPALHRWNLSPRQAIALQRQLASQLQIHVPKSQPKRAAGLDAAFDDNGRTCVAAVVLWEIATASVLEIHTAQRPVRFPYIPGLLSFREAPALLAALRKLSELPDVLLCDGHGIAHPRRFGIACHLGLLCNLPALGCGKTLLCGQPGMPDDVFGARADLLHRGERIGEVVRTRSGVRPVFISPGHLLDQSASTSIALQCVDRHRLPEPIHLADRLLNSRKRNSLQVSNRASR